MGEIDRPGEYTQALLGKLTECPICKSPSKADSDSKAGLVKQEAPTYAERVVGHWRPN